MSDRAPAKNCRNCRNFQNWVSSSHGQFADDIGECRALPPTVVIHEKYDGPVARGFWPLANQYDWCGRFVLSSEID